MAFVPATTLGFAKHNLPRLLPRRTVPVCSSQAHESTQTPKKFSLAAMTVDDFFERSVGEWRSQRSSHNLLWSQFEQITSEISIQPLQSSHPDVIKLCNANDVDVNQPFFSLKMTWEGESDWDEEISQGQTIMSVIKDGQHHGRLLRSAGYAETIPAVGKWRMSPDGVFILDTFYDAAAAEERIWFANPNLRMRVSQILTSAGSGVVSASFSTEIRRVNQ